MIEYPKEMQDFKKVIEFGAEKYRSNGWLEKDGYGTSHKEMCDSMFHHLCDVRNGITKDHDSGLHPALHLACRILMLYTRQKRGIVNSKDKFLCLK